MNEAVAALGLNNSDVICYSPSKEEEMPAGSKRMLFEANPINRDEHEKISNAISSLIFNIHYSSIYNEKFQLQELHSNLKI